MPELPAANQVNLTQSKNESLLTLGNQFSQNTIGVGNAHQ